jgi:L-aminopeptidase/D-esterase-like protein
VVRELLEDGRGHPTPATPVPIVPAAVVFDLPLEGGGVRPGPEQGALAYRAATANEVTMGRVGAGASTSSGKWRGFDLRVMTGIGSASVATPDGHLVAALAVMNPVGDVFGLDGRSLTGGDPIPGPPAPPPWAGTNTTLISVVTDAAMSRAELTRLGIRAHDAIGACVRPAHTRFDGDVVFMTAVGAARGDVDLAAEAAFVACGLAIEKAVSAS